jgi:hypothetical protein
LNRVHRLFAFFVLVFCFLAYPVASRASNNCAWLSEATASGLLGGDAVGAFTDATAGQPAVCVFTSEEQGARRTLRVTVEVTGDAHARLATEERSCGSDAAPLRAIGNEAVACAADDRKGGRGERAVGRVRDQVFTITISSSLRDDPILTRDALKTRIYTAAEQVSGNLF